MHDIWNLPEEKKVLRKELKRLRAGIPFAARESIDRQIAHRLMQQEAFLSAGTIFIYYSVGEEVSTHEVIAQALAMGKIVTLPRVRASHIMDAVRYTGDAGERMSVFHGIPEPVDGEIYAPREIDLAVVPCLACTAAGVRLGYGGGFYDHWLENFEGCALVLCRDEFVYPSLPAEEHDRKVDGIVTERRTIKIGWSGI